VPILGAHKSIAGGLHKAVERAAACGCQCVQLFTRNATQWRAKAIEAEDARRFRRALDEYQIGHPMVHDSYLINLASPDRRLWRRSVDAFVEELRRAHLLEIPYVITHPGAYTSSTESAGLGRIIEALDEVEPQVRDCRAGCLLETTAGQGTSLGWRFEQLAAILDTVRNPDWLGVCFDTCHVFAAGYPLGTSRQYEATMKAFDRVIGLDQIRAIHLNDSAHPLGSRMDRHAHIGRGHMGLAPFRHLLADPRFQQVPMYIETPKGERRGVDWDVINLRTLRRLSP